MRRFFFAAALLSSSLSAAGALAQVADEPATTTLPLDRFRAPIDDKGLGVTEGGAIPGHLAFQTGLIFNYALNPLVLRDGNGDVVASIVAHRLAADALFTIGLFEYVSVGVDLPLTLVQVGGEVPADLQETVGVANGLAGIGVGDLRLVPKVRLLREDVHYVSLSLIPTITLPTAGGVRFNDDGPEYEYGGDYLGEGPGAFAFIPEVAVSTNIMGLRPAANLAYRLRQPARFLGAFQIHPELVYRLGLGYELSSFMKGVDGLMVFGEVFGATADRNPFGLVNGDDPAEVRLQNPVELLVGARWKAVEGVTVEGGAGSGIRAGYGSPDLRLFLGVRYGVEDNDKDDDGVEDKKDTCVDEPEDKDGHDDADGCPDRDNDGDGIPDGSDKCPDAAEDTDSFEDEDGCPDLDNDKDGVPDFSADGVDDECRDVAGKAQWKGCPPPDKDGDGFTDDVDACPDVPGIVDRKGCPEDDKDKDGVKDADDECIDVAGSKVTRGCPDKDGDGIRDSEDRCKDVAGVPEFKGCIDTDNDGLADPDDKCPTEPETINGIDDGDGCPDKGKVLVVVTKDKIELKETVFFDPGKATIQQRSSSLLDQIALVMKAHPEVKKIRIEGHTDSDGDEKKNLELSKKRARAVLDAIVSRGVDPLRLESDGYGEGQPIADNKTKAGKAANRRVELKVLD